jgi:hypothetical protein
MDRDELLARDRTSADSTGQQPFVPSGADLCHGEVIRRKRNVPRPARMTVGPGCAVTARRSRALECGDVSRRFAFDVAAKAATAVAALQGASRFRMAKLQGTGAPCRTSGATEIWRPTHGSSARRSRALRRSLSDTRRLGAALPAGWEPPVLAACLARQPGDAAPRLAHHDRRAGPTAWRRADLGCRYRAVEERRAVIRECGRGRPHSYFTSSRRSVISVVRI